MEQINNTTELIGLKVTLQKALYCGSHREIYAKLDYTPPLCSHCQGTMIKKDVYHPFVMLRIPFSRFLDKPIKKE